MPTEYAHRKNSDGTIDSICLFCFQTIAIAKIEEELAVPERGHNCYRKKEPARASAPAPEEQFGEN